MRQRRLRSIIPALMALFATAAYGERIVIDGSTGGLPMATALAKAYQDRHPGTAIEIGKGLGTKARLVALADGKIDIALASHGIDPAQMARQGMAVHEIASVAVVFGVNASVPVAGLTTRQVCDLYAGTATHWDAVGGPSLAVAARTRPDSEVDAEVVRDKLACLKGLVMPASVTVMAKTSDMARELAATPGAIGMTTMTVVEQSGGRIRAVALDGVEPSRANVEGRSYALLRESMFAVRSPPAPAVARFLDFVRSPAGQAVIVSNGAVPVKSP
jgi:phosphate transport system substrate-binding protein